VAQTEKHAVITGGGSGIGLAIAKAVAASGWRVTIMGRNRNKLEAAAGVLGAARVQVADVTDPEQVLTALHAAASASGAILLLVNNAGGVASASFEKTSLQAWHQAINLNLMGTVHCIRAVLPGMKAARWGRIVNVASTAGLVGYRYVSAYVAAKHAIVGLTRALALELAKSGITVNAVCPGYTDTDLIASAVAMIGSATHRTAEEAMRTFTAINPQGRLVKPEEVAAAVVWLASDEAAAVNGIALPIAGGEVG